MISTLVSGLLLLGSVFGAAGVAPIPPEDKPHYGFG
jgi:hypothetical protein